jgi:hypothetical protein
LSDLETVLAILWASCFIMVIVQTLPTYLTMWYKLTCYSNTTSWEDFKSCFGLSQFVCYTGMKFWLITGKERKPCLPKITLLQQKTNSKLKTFWDFYHFTNTMGMRFWKFKTYFCLYNLYGIITTHWTIHFHVFLCRVWIKHNTTSKFRNKPTSLTISLK